MKKVIIGLSLTLMSVFGTVSVAHAQSSYAPSEEQQAQQKESSNAPSAYYQFGFGEVKADGQWVNDK